MLMKRTERTCGPVPAMQTAERRVAETTVDAALQRLSASGVDASRAAVRALLIAEQKLDELGVRCDLVERLMNLEQGYRAVGLDGHPSDVLRRVVRSGRDEDDHDHGLGYSSRRRRVADGTG